jgi:predicted Fe-Mo cluster-binding NifX family protein
MESLKGRESFMKIAISATGTTLDAQIDERFGRAAYILIVDTDSLDVEALDNSANISVAQGAGIQAASMVCAKGAKALLTGSCGPKAMNAFSVGKVDVYTGQQGTVREAVERFRQGGLMSSDKANVGEKYGKTGSGPGVSAIAGFQPMGVGRCMGGSGRGMGLGGGRGRGLGGRRMGMGNPVSQAQPPASKAETLDELKKQADALKSQLDDIQQKIEKL